MLLNINNLSRHSIIIFVTLIFGLVTIIATQAATETVSIQPETGIKNGAATIVSDTAASGGSAIKFASSNQACGNRIQNYGYQVPFGNAVWNQPVCNLTRHPRSDDYASRFYNWSNVNDGTPSSKFRDGNLKAYFGLPEPTFFDPEGLNALYSRNVYYAKDATKQMQVYSWEFMSNLDGINSQWSYEPTATIPWNDNWKTGMAGDNEIVILDDQTGKIWEIAGLKQNWYLRCIDANRLCTRLTNIGRDTTGQIIDYRTYPNFFNDGRGVGLSMYQTFTTPEEVDAGEIRHALGVQIPNTAFGPVCTVAQQGTFAEGANVGGCGVALAPATKFELGIYSNSLLQEPFRSLYTREKTIPEGMRFAVNLTDEDINNWINSKPVEYRNDTKKVRTARIFANALRDYGFIIVDTNGFLADIQMAGSANPNSKALWAKNGMDSFDDYDILEGLIKLDKLYVVEPPTIKCLDDTFSKYYCKWTTATYSL